MELRWKALAMAPLLAPEPHPRSGNTTANAGDAIGSQIRCIVITALRGIFVVVFSVMFYSIFAHRKSKGTGRAVPRKHDVSHLDRIPF